MNVIIVMYFTCVCKVLWVKKINLGKWLLPCSNTIFGLSKNHNIEILQPGFGPLKPKIAKICQFCPKKSCSVCPNWAEMDLEIHKI